MIKKSKTLIGFTLIEIMIGVLIFSVALIWGFKAYNSVLIWKVKLIEKTTIQKEAFFFSEKLFEEIKKGGLIDYEEYFNRERIGAMTFWSGHYKKRSWFGNEGDFYYCRSWDRNWNWILMWTGWCFNNTDLNHTGRLFTDVQQRYGEYKLQYIDYNSDADDDWWDADRDNEIRRDWDDRRHNNWPKAFSLPQVKEIYLISADKKRRTYFRWKIQDDPDSPESCDFNTGSGWCQSTIEFLKLEWRDWWDNHNISNVDSNKSQYDGEIDTWIVNRDFVWGSSNTVAKSTGKEYWQPLFGDNVNVTNFKVFLYPSKDGNIAFEDRDSKVNPYIRIKMELVPTYKVRKGIRWSIPVIPINTTISLTDIYSH